MDLLVPVAAAMVSFVAAYLFLPWLIRSLRGTTLVGRDLNKPHSPLVPEMGGIAVILGFYVGGAILVAFAIPVGSGSLFFAALSACLGAGVVGLMDDMFRLRKRYKAILPFGFLFPLGAALTLTKNHPSRGSVTGSFMAIVFPRGLQCGWNARTRLKGFNGLG